MKASGISPKTYAFPEWFAEQDADEYLEWFHQPQNCRKLFNTWKPIHEALDRNFNTNQRQIHIFMSSLSSVMVASFSLFDEDPHYSKEPIAYCAFKDIVAAPVGKANAVFVTVVDPVHGPILQLKAAVPLKAGNLVRVFKMHGRSQRLNFRKLNIVDNTIICSRFTVL